ncbi:hypothetical protein H5J25_04550 [Sphingomonas aliaeris]|uniref:Uncharacterized protein n=1 Tax=Sphingomonas aliaeris TaxID=2759526 RepID=A0A974NW59_9SPHN|nr:hypothetical protein [Sphingomonas aliaeris]QQV78016.1 hypothetical protein H5J25_04550 [Sphingomonas aliaeris]
MRGKLSEQHEYELDRALLDEHGPSYIDTICSFVEGMRAEGRDADADDAMRQCARMWVILQSDQELLADWHAIDGEAEEADLLAAEINRRGLDL